MMSRLSILGVSHPWNDNLFKSAWVITYKCIGITQCSMHVHTLLHNPRPVGQTHVMMMTLYGVTDQELTHCQVGMISSH